MYDSFQHALFSENGSGMDISECICKQCIIPNKCVLYFKCLRSQTLFYKNLQFHNREFQSRAKYINNIFNYIDILAI